MLLCVILDVLVYKYIIYNVTTDYLTSTQTCFAQIKVRNATKILTQKQLYNNQTADNHVF